MNYKYNIKTLYLTVPILLGLFNYASSQEKSISVFEENNPDGSISFYASNTYPNPFTAVVNFDVLTNYKSSISLPFKGIINSNTKKIFLFKITPTSTSNIKYSYSCKYYSDGKISDNKKSSLPNFINCTEEKSSSLCVTLSEFNSEELDTSLFDYEWVLGDGNILKGSKIKYCYTNYGEYTIKLNVFDKFTNENLFNVATEKIYVKKEAGLFFDIPATAKINEKVLIENVITDLDGYDNNKIYWDFGDGNKAMGNKNNHIFTAEGNYTVKLGVLSIIGTNKQCVFKQINITK